MLHKKDPMILCSACLLGICCRYDGNSKPSKKVMALAGKEILVPVCPEQMGGLPIPREPSEKKGNRVLSRDGKDVTENFHKGAREVLKIAKILGIKKAVLKQRSPSCGCGQVYDGNFSGKVVAGDGITTILLKRNGICVISEEDI